VGVGRERAVPIAIAALARLVVGVVAVFAVAESQGRGGGAAPGDEALEVAELVALDAARPCGVGIDPHPVPAAVTVITAERNRGA
jgi:hypothetical protein